ncbi:succinylglutamate desuccinylase/aspartoacylase family protein [Basilea psittacipulmonis]|uniref:Succinylglutamate desuccinylase/Aspartoacylase catalytic domain-containing protein n=1 Tax=Basilea psittacipulmonis DSM 24701 TaxID=1072685 RepID=A0A077DHK9_9BURK|nr:succinylglutamate desuccinylase/aspartoacylase family protein [Basilea psittacipulmonis]AIL33047.1 hypothetical protein IX83_06760 [Basilea psittacipulmonis DSM 24701]
MLTQHFKLSHTTPGMDLNVTSFQFGPAGTRKVYIQASLHADEIPGSLVIFFLKKHLKKLEAEQKLHCQVVLVPYCNPIGMSQQILQKSIGRHSFESGQNFNRLGKFYFLDHLIKKISAADLSPTDASSNTAWIRRMIKEILDQHIPESSIDELHHHLLSLSYDADIVLDLHCDEQSIMHLYTLPQLWQKGSKLARFINSQCHLLSQDSGSHSFDEILSIPWLKLQEAFPKAAITLACFSATIELRGQQDLCLETAENDALAILSFLHEENFIHLDNPKTPSNHIPEPHPLSGLSYVKAPQSGIFVPTKKAGDWVDEHTIIGHIVDPLNDTITPIHSPIQGIIFSVALKPMAKLHQVIFSISGAKDIGHTGLTL